MDVGKVHKVGGVDSDSTFKDFDKVVLKWGV